MMFDSSLITRKTNLANNDSLSSYKDWTAQQHYNAFEVFYNLIRDVKPCRILEIGTALGGLTRFIDYSCEDNGIDCTILSYDIVEQPWYKDIITDKLQIVVKNIFSSDYSNVDTDIISFIQKPGLCIVLCDGGNKKEEFRILSGFLKPNDIIMAHDYAPNPSFFNKYINNQIWNWHEIQDSDIDDACRRYNLAPFMQDALTDIVWVGRRKL